MTTNAIEPGGSTDARVGENVNTLMFREHVSARTLGPRVGMASETLSRRLRDGKWLFAEVVAVADYFTVELAELTGELPDVEVWRARRDSNPKPSVLYPRRGPLTLVAVNRVLTPYYVPTEARTRHLRAVS